MLTLHSLGFGHLCRQARKQGLKLTERTAFATESRMRPNAAWINLDCEPSRDRIKTGLGFWQS